jgi:hypothetical protein
LVSNKRYVWKYRNHKWNTLRKECLAERSKQELPRVTEDPPSTISCYYLHRSVRGRCMLVVVMTVSSVRNQNVVPAPLVQTISQHRQMMSAKFVCASFFNARRCVSRYQSLKKSYMQKVCPAIGRSFLRETNAIKADVATCPDLSSSTPGIQR